MTLFGFKILSNKEFKRITDWWYDSGYNSGRNFEKEVQQEAVDKLEATFEMMKDQIKILEDENQKYDIVIRNQAEAIRQLKKKLKARSIDK